MSARVVSGTSQWDRFWAKVDFSGSCWEWTAGHYNNGYGVFNLPKSALAHRVAWQSLVGDIPTGMQIDHLCRNRGCVNPDHLEVVDNYTNTRRGYGPTAVNARATVCKRGHSLTPENAPRDRRGQRRCKACRRVGAKEVAA